MRKLFSCLLVLLFTSCSGIKTAVKHQDKFEEVVPGQIKLIELPDSYVSRKVNCSGKDYVVAGNAFLRDSINKAINETYIKRMDPSTRKMVGGTGPIKINMTNPTQEDFEKIKTLNKGDVYIAPKGVWHGDSGFGGDDDLDECWILDIFTPPRDDLRNKA